MQSAFTGHIHKHKTNKLAARSRKPNPEAKTTKTTIMAIQNPNNKQKTQQHNNNSSLKSNPKSTEPRALRELNLTKSKSKAKGPC